MDADVLTESKAGGFSLFFRGRSKRRKGGRGRSGIDTRQHRRELPKGGVKGFICAWATERIPGSVQAQGGGAVVKTDTLGWSFP